MIAAQRRRAHAACRNRATARPFRITPWENLMNCRFLAALSFLAAACVQAAPVWLEVSPPRSAFVYAGVTTPGGVQLLGGSYYDLYGRTTPAAAWQLWDGPGEVWSFARDTGGRIYAGGQAGLVARSDDQGASWQHSFFPCSPCFAAVDFVSVTPSGALIASLSGGETYRSTDRGLSWALTSNGLPSLYVRPDVAASSNGILYAVGDSRLNFSTDDGASWQLDPLFSRWQQVEALPANELLLSDEYGELWRRSAGGSLSQSGLGQVSSRIRVLYHAADGRWLAATDSGIYRAEANLATWTAVGPGVLGVRQFLPQPGGGVLAIGSRGIARSDAQFQNWQEDMNGVSAPLLAGIVAAGNSLFASTINGEVFRSDDGAASWSRSLAGLPTCGLDTLARLDNGRLLVVCSWSHYLTYTSTDDGASWTLLSSLPVVDAAVSASASVAVALRSGTGLWRSVDGGTNWTRSNQSFDAESPAQLVRGGDGALWVRTSTALYRSTDLGASWQPAGSGLASPATQTLWPVSSGVLSFGPTQAYRYSGASWVPFGDAYSAAPDNVLETGGNILLTRSDALLLGSAASGQWRRISSRGLSLEDFARTTDGRVFAIGPYFYGAVYQLSDDRLFADTFDKP